MTGVSIGIIAERIVLAVSDGGTPIIAEMTPREAIRIAEMLTTAIRQVGRGQSQARSWQEFIEGFGY